MRDRESEREKEWEEENEKSLLELHRNNRLYLVVQVILCTVQWLSSFQQGIQSTKNV